MDPFVRLRPGLEWQQIDDEVVVLDLDTSAYLAVNDTGAVLWPLVAAGTTAGRLADELTSRFGIDDQRAHADVGDFVAQLRSISLVVEEG